MGKTRSDFMLEAACERAQSVLLDQIYFRLDDQRHAAFLRQLDGPTAPNPGLERLMRVTPPWAKPAAKPATTKRGGKAR